MNFIDLKTQYQNYKQEIDKAVLSVLESGGFVMGKLVTDLETRLADYVGVKHALAVSSGTDGLLIALMALGIGRDDAVITTPFTFIATAEAVSLVGATPIFVDIEPDTCNMDVKQLQNAILECERRSLNPKAIIPVSLYGQCADMESILQFAREKKLFVIEDGCQSFGATRNGKHSCAFEHIGVTSFYPSKPLGCYGDGGMVFTDDTELADKMAKIRVHGQSRTYEHEMIGINGRLDAIQAAILLAKFQHFDSEMQKRNEIAAHYSQSINKMCPAIKTPVICPENTSVFAQYTIQIGNDKRASVAQFLAKKSIPTAIHYPKPIHLQPAYSFLGYKKGEFPVSEQASQEVLSLPMHPFLTREQQDEVVMALSEALKN